MAVTFSFVEATQEQKELMNEFREKFQVLYDEIQEKVPNSRGKSTSLTNLEQASMWLNKGITNNS